jgi:hypothetical protein
VTKLRLRQALASLLLAGAAAPILWGGWESWPEGWSFFALGGILMAGAVGVSRSARWARWIALAWSIPVGLFGLPVLFLEAPIGGALLAYAILLAGSLAGSRTFDHFERWAPGAGAWSRPGMSFVRAALIANLGALMGGMALLPVAFPEGECLDCPQPPRPIMIVFTALALVSASGVLLLARRKTAGLLLVVLPAAATTVIFTLLSHADHQRGALALMLVAPAVVSGGAALLRCLPAMVRFLRAQVPVGH